jgi:hypothetical protein
MNKLTRDVYRAIESMGAKVTQRESSRKGHLQLIVAAPSGATTRISVACSPRQLEVTLSIVKRQVKQFLNERQQA